MGSQVFTVISRGMSAKEAYERAVETANDEYGHQEGYSGAINATPGFRDATDKYKASGLPKYNFIERRLDKLTKFDGAECICIREPKVNKNKIKTQVQNLVEAGTKKWVLKYSVKSSGGDVIGQYSTKTEAVSKARDYTERTKKTTSVIMVKELEKSNPVVARITYKMSKDEKEGEWEFYGWAAC